MYSKQKLVWAFFKRHPFRIALALFMGFIASILHILLPISLGKYFDLLFGYHSKRAHFLDSLPFSFWDSIPEFILFFMVATTLWLLSNFISRYLTAELGVAFSHELRVQLFERQMFIPIREYERKGSGKYLLRYSGDLGSIRNYLVRGVLRFAIDLGLILLALLGLYMLNAEILSGLLLGFGLILIVVYFLNRILYEKSVQLRNKRSGLLAYVAQRLRAMDTIQAFNRYVPEEKRFAERSKTVYETGKRYQRIFQLIFTLVPVMLYWALAITLYAFALEGDVSKAQHGNLVAFILLFITVLPIFRRLIRISTVWKVGNISFQKLIRILELGTPENIPDTPFEWKGGTISLQNLGFSYDGQKFVLRGLNADIPAKAFAFFKGRSGSGKTTLIKLLLALYQPTEGLILIDDQDSRELNPKSLRRYITVVSEEFPLLGRTVFEAISYSRQKEKRPKAQKILDYLQAGLPPEKHLQLDDRIGELGDRLSKGQTKMLLYARAMLSGKPILLIEDPFKNLHSAVRRQITHWIEKKRGKRSILFFSSRAGLGKDAPAMDIEVEM